MFKTRITELFGIEYPIVSAGMGGVAMAELAGAVSEAGGLGTLALAGLRPEAIQNEIGTARRITKKPLVVNLLVPFLAPGIVETLLKAPIQAITFFWGDPAEHIPPVKKAGMKVIWQCGSVAEAVAAKDAGADVIMVQGVEAGGHVRGTTTTLAFIPAARDAIGPNVPLLASGGFADGRGLAAALALGADGAVFGTRFLASRESAAHAIYKQRVIDAEAEETIHTELFDIGWPHAPHRVIRTKLVEEWERAGRPESGKRPGEGQPVGSYKSTGPDVPLVRYSVMTPTDNIEGDVEQLPFYAGMSVNLVNDIMPAAGIVRRIAREAQQVITGRLASVVQ
jgi:NAD(P)H-dependent flavin oxidoreductase YrpB (nitropropane dioxygenase family)